MAHSDVADWDFPRHFLDVLYRRLIGAQEEEWLSIDEEVNAYIVYLRRKNRRLQVEVYTVKPAFMWLLPSKGNELKKMTRKERIVSGKIYVFL